MFVLLLQISLPDRTCEVHRLKLSEDEQAVYDVVFAQSRYIISLNIHLFAYSVPSTSCCFACMVRLSCLFPPQVHTAELSEET